jgi:virginiamycin B lyase
LKELIIGTILLLVLLYAVQPITVEAIPSDQRNVLIKSWALPPTTNQAGDFAITSSFSGNEIYYVDSNSNKIGRLVPQSNTITEWELASANSNLTSIDHSPSGSVYFVDSNSNKIGRLVPETNTITEWSIPSNSSSIPSGQNNSEANGNNLTQVSSSNSSSIPSGQNNSEANGNNLTQVSSVSVDPSTGSVYFVDSNSNKIGRLVPETNTITEWSIQSNTTQIQSMSVGFSGNEIYFVDTNANKIGRLAPTTNLVTEWDIPTPNSLPTSVKFDPSTGSVYFVESNSNKIGRLLPFHNEFTEWNLMEKPSNIEIDTSGNLHYIVGNGTKIVRMD